MRIYLFNATGNKILILDARSAAVFPNRLIDKLISHMKGIQKEFQPEIYTVLTLTHSKVRADFWNPDASQENLCGNALRCLPYIIEKDDFVTGQKITIETAHCDVWVKSRGYHTGILEMNNKDIQIKVLGKGRWLIDPGTPHLVISVNRINSRNCVCLGQKLSHSQLPTNVTFVMMTPGELFIRTFERGVGETASCGSGAIAAFLAYKQAVGESRTCNRCIKIRFLSGELLNVFHAVSSDNIVLWGSYKIIKIYDYMKEIDNGIHHCFVE